MKSKPKLALITRTKNRNVLLERALMSVATQTSNDFIHVILNDGGDKSAVEELLKKYPANNRHVIHNRASVGLTVALNQAIRAVDSEYIAVLDDDDTIAPTRIEATVKYLEETSAPAIVNFMDRVIERVENGKIEELSRERWHEGVVTVSLYKQCLDNYISNGCVTYRRDVYDELGGYDEGLDVAEDWDFGIRILLKHDIDFLITDEPLSLYHHRPEQKGYEGNSVFAGIDTHTRNLQKLRNKYLRQDIINRSFGIGYIMNSLADAREQYGLKERADLEKVIRLEGHMNRTTEEIKVIIKDSVRIAINAQPYRVLKRKIKRKLSGK